MDSRFRGNDKGARGNDTFLVAPAKAGVHASNQGWMPVPSLE